LECSNWQVVEFLGDYVEAYIWFRLADFNSNPNLSLAKAHMTPEQILEVEQLVEVWKSRGTKSN
jgi:hypothetical protein